MIFGGGKGRDMYERGVSVRYDKAVGGFVKADEGVFVAVPKVYFEEVRSRALLATDLMGIGTEAVEKADCMTLRLERAEMKCSELCDVQVEKDTYEKAFYRMRDRTVNLVRAIRGHKSATSCGGHAVTTNATLWNSTRDYPGRQ